MATVRNRARLSRYNSSVSLGSVARIGRLDQTLGSVRCCTQSCRTKRGRSVTTWAGIRSPDSRPDKPSVASARHPHEPWCTYDALPGSISLSSWRKLSSSELSSSESSSSVQGISPTRWRPIRVRASRWHEEAP